MAQPKTLHREGYYNYDEAAKYLEVSERTIRNHIKRGLLTPVGMQRPYRIPQEQVHALLPQRQEVAPPPPPKPVESPFYTVAEAAAYLRVGKATIYDLIKRGLLRCSLALREKRLLKEDVHTFHQRTCA